MGRKRCLGDVCRAAGVTEIPAIWKGPGVAVGRLKYENLRFPGKYNGKAIPGTRFQLSVALWVDFYY